MIAAPVLAWLAVLLGIIAAFVLGWRAPKGARATVRILFNEALIGLSLCLVLFFVFSLCLKAGVCVPTNDKTVWSLYLPLLFVPGYWLVTIFVKVAQFWKPVTESTAE